MKFFIPCLLIVLSLSGCWNVSYTDVSHQKKYNHLIGKNMKSPVEFMLTSLTRACVALSHI